MRSRKPRRLAEEELLQYALRSLGAKAQSRAELRSRLAARAASQTDVDKVVARLAGYGYLDDAAFAETYARLRAENQTHGRFRVLRDLRSRRVGAPIAEKAVAEAFRDVDEDALIQKHIEKRLRGGKRDYASLVRSLLRAGFRSGKIIEALRKHPVPPEYIDGLESATGEEVPD